MAIALLLTAIGISGIIYFVINIFEKEDWWYFTGILFSSFIFTLGLTGIDEAKAERNIEVTPIEVVPSTVEYPEDILKLHKENYIIVKKGDEYVRRIVDKNGKVASEFTWRYNTLEDAEKAVDRVVKSYRDAYVNDNAVEVIVKTYKQ